MKKIINFKVALMVTFLLSFASNIFAQGEDIKVPLPSTDKTEIFSVEIMDSEKKQQKVSLYEFYGKSSDGRKMLALTFDGALFEQSKGMNPDSTFLLLSGPILDDARILQLMKEFGDLIRTKRDVYRDSLDYYSVKHYGIKKRERKRHKIRIKKLLVKIEDSNRRNLDYYLTILTVRKSRAIIVYGHQFKKKPISKTSSTLKPKVVRRN